MIDVMERRPATGDSRRTAGARLFTATWRLASVAWSTVAGLGLILLVWWLASEVTTDLPGPVRTLSVLWELVRNPFYDNGPNDKGVALQILGSLGRVFLGFGLGAMVAIELFENGDPSRPDAALTRRVVAEAARRGLILLSCGSYGNVIRILVPLTASDALLDEGLQILADSLKASR